MFCLFLTLIFSRRSHAFRYVLRNKQTGEPYLVIVFTIYLREDVNEDGTLKKGAAERVVEGIDGRSKSYKDHDEEKALKEAEAKLGPKVANNETSADDVD